MDAVQGETLDVFAAGRRFDEVRPAFIDVARALAYLHRSGRAHGDVKPDNVIVGPDGRATVIDLSCARRFGAAGNVSGTPGYLAPEALRGAPASARHDVFGLGVSVRAVARSLADGLPEPVSALVRRMVRDDPAARPAEMAEVLELLGDASGAAPARGSQPRRSIGRDREHEALQAFLAAVERGDAGPRLAVVRGSRGMGASRLLREIKWAAQRRMRVVEAFAHGPAPMASLIRRIAGDDARADLRLAAMAAVDRLRALGDPALLVVDDADALDGIDREALDVIARLVGPTDPFGLLVSHRGGASPELFGASERTIDIALGALDEASVAAWIADVGRDDDPHRTWQATGGVPGDLAVVLSGDEAARDRDGDVEGQLAALGPDEREALSYVVALAPLAAETELAQMAVGAAALAAIQARGLAVRRIGGWALARPLHTDRIAARLDLAATHDTLARRARERLADVALDADARADAAASAVRHLASAGKLPEAVSLVRSSLAAIERRPAPWRAPLAAVVDAGVEDGALDLAAALLAAGDGERARRLADARLAHAEATGDARADVRLLAARCALEGDDAAGALRLATAGLDLARTDEERARLSEVLARAHIRLGDHAAARAAAEPALALARDPSLLADLHEDAGVAASFLADHAVARVHLAAAAALGRDLSSPKRLLRALSYQAIDAYRAADLPAALSGYRQALAVAEENGLAAQMARASLNLGTASHASGRLGDALAAYERGQRLASALGQADLAVVLEFNVAKLYADAGAFERARARALSCRALATERAMPFFVAAAASVDGDCALALGDAAEAVRAFEAARAGFERVGAAREEVEERIELARAALAAGSWSSSARRVASARAAEAVRDAPDLAARAALVAARVALASREPPVALAEAHAALRHARTATQPDLEAEARMLEADALEALGRRAEAQEPLAAARELWARLADSLPEPLRDGFFRHPRRRDLREPVVAQRSSAREGRAEKLERLVTLFRKLNTSLEVPDVLSMTLDAAIELTNAERGFVVLAGADGAMRVPVARNIDRERVGKSHLKFSRSIAERAIESGEPVVTVDAQSDERFRENASVHAMKLRSVLAVPIRSPGGVLGSLYVDNRFGRGRFEPDDVELLLSFADQAALALRNASLLDELRDRTRELEAERSRIADVARGQAEEIGRLAEEVKVRQEALESRYDFGAIVGKSPSLRSVFRTLDRVVDAPVSVLVTGESGTGKELVARALHFASARKAGPFVGINCAALPASLLESELFGHVRGAFTGAERDRTGLMVAARGGTLFLDELGELPLDMQAKLLRVLQEREVRPLGSSDAVAVDFRLVCATNRELRDEVARGRFREDLFFRVGVVEVALPPLRDRLEDLPALAAHFLRRASGELGRPPLRISGSAMRRLSEHPFPGNVRELENVLMRAAVMCEKSEIGVDDLGLHAPLAAKRRRPPNERDAYEAALERTGWNVVQAARDLGVPRATFYRKLERFGLDGARQRKRVAGAAASKAE